LQSQYDKAKDAKDGLREHNIRLEHNNHHLELQLQEAHDHLDDMHPPDFSNPLLSIDGSAAGSSTSNLLSTGNESQKSELETNFDDLMAKIIKDRERLKREEESMSSNLDLLGNGPGFD